MGKLLSSSSGLKKFFAKEIIKTYLLGNGFGVHIYRKELSDGREVPGYAYSFMRYTRDGKPDIDNIASVDKLDVRVSNYSYHRESHESNSPVKTSKGYNEIVIVFKPNLEHYGNAIILEDDSGGHEFTVSSVEHMTNDAQVFCSLMENKNLEASFKPFDPSHDLTDTANLKSMDELITDESTYYVLKHYVLPEEVTDSDVYKYLRDNEMEYFYSRKRLVEPSTAILSRNLDPDNVDMNNK